MPRRPALAPIVVTRPFDLDTALADVSTAPIHLRGSGIFFVRSDRGRHICAYDTVEVGVFGNTALCAYDGAQVAAWDVTNVHLYDQSRSTARGDSTVYAHGRSGVKAFGRSTVHADGSTRVASFGTSVVYACGHTTIGASEASTVVSDEDCTVTSRGNVRVLSFGTGAVEPDGSSVVFDLAGLAGVTRDLAIGLIRRGFTGSSADVVSAATALTV